MFQIISDGGSDFTKQEATDNNIHVVPFYISFDETTFLREGIDIHKEEYFERLFKQKGVYAKTSQANPQDFIDVFTPYLQEGKDILCITISSKMSGSYNSAVIARDTIKEDYPDRKIEILDSLNGSISQGLILREIIKMRDLGKSLSDTIEIANKVIKTTRVYFTIDNVEYLKRSGRIGPTTALVGGLLNLKPILHLVDGAVAQLDSVRGKKNVIKRIEEGLVEALRDVKDKISINVGHILCLEDAQNLKNSIETSLGIKFEYPITEVGATVGTHCGPGTLTFAYCKRYDAV